MNKLFKHRDSYLLFGAFVLLVVTLLRPTIPLRQDLHNYLFIVDITQSMNTADMLYKEKQISRIDYVNQLLKETVPQLPCGTKVSLGIFSAGNIALLFTPIEVCQNYDVIQDSIHHVEWRMAWKGNSRLRFAMHSTASILDTLKVPSQIVFFTDGDEAPKLNAINKLDLSGWQRGDDWIIAGVGGDTPSPIPKLDSENKILGYWAFVSAIMAPSRASSEDTGGGRDNSIATDEYEYYLSKLEETYLQELSDELGANYLRVTDATTLATAMSKQKAAGSDVIEIEISWILILMTISLLLAGYWKSLKLKLLRK